jgi:recombination protein RecR
MLDYAEPVTKLIDELKRLPGIGHKSAQRLAFYILRADREEAERLIEDHSLLYVQQYHGC